MSWNAQLIDGPLEGRSVPVDEEQSGPPPVLEVDGSRYLYCGFADNTPRYKFDKPVVQE